MKCFSFTASRGLEEGIELVLDAPRLDNSGRCYPPHFRVGEHFLARDREVGCKYVNGRVFDARLRTVTPFRGRPFTTLAKPTPGEDDPMHILLYFSLRISNLKREIRERRIWTGVTTGAERLMTAPVDQEGLLLLKEQDQVVCFLPDGRVERLVCAAGVVRHERLEPLEMLEERLLEAQRQLCMADDDSRRRGVLFGVIRITPLTRGDTRERLLDWLHAQELHAGMRAALRQELYELGDPRQWEFAGSEPDPRVVAMTSGRRGPPPKRVQQRLERAARDRAEREAARGKRGKEQKR